MSSPKQLNPSYLKHGGRHSEGKRFTFQSFGQRIASLDIDVHRRLTADDMAEWRDEADDERPFALQTLERWEELNQTRPFKTFRNVMQPLLLSVPLILRRKETVFETLNEHLSSAPVDSLKPMLEVATALAVDLRQEYTPHFGPVLHTLGTVLGKSAADVGVLEDIFTTIAYLFKYLLRQLLADLPTAFGHYTRLLSHDKQHVRDFAAETFAYLIRRVPRGALPHELRSTLLPHVGTSEALDSGIALLLFHAVKGLPQRFNSRAPEIIEALLASLRPAGSGVQKHADASCERRGVASGSSDGMSGAEARASSVSRSALLGVLSEGLGMMGEHTRKEHCEPVWASLLAALSEGSSALVAALGEDRAVASDRGTGGGEGIARVPTEGVATHRSSTRASNAAAHMAALCRLMREWVSRRFASRVPVGGLAPLMRALAPLFARQCLTATASRLRHRARHAILWEALQLASTILVADTKRAEDEASAAIAAGVLPRHSGADALLAIAQGFLPIVLSEEFVGEAMATNSASTAGATAQDNTELCLLPLHFGVALMPWRHFATAALPLLLTLCAATAPQHPSEVISTLYALTTAAPPLPPLNLPSQCLLTAIGAIESVAVPTSPGEEDLKAATTQISHTQGKRAEAASTAATAQGAERAVVVGGERDAEAAARDAWAAAMVLRRAAPECLFGPQSSTTARRASRSKARPDSPATFPVAGAERCLSALFPLTFTPPPRDVIALPESQKAALVAAALDSIAVISATGSVICARDRRAARSAPHFISSELRKTKSKGCSSRVEFGDEATEGAPLSTVVERPLTLASIASLALESTARHLNTVSTSESVGEVGINNDGPSVALLRACASSISKAGAESKDGATRPEDWEASMASVQSFWPPLLRCLAHGATAIRGAALELLVALNEGGRLPVVGEDGLHGAERLGGLRSQENATAGLVSTSSETADNAQREAVREMLRLCLALEAAPQSPTSRQLVIDADALARLAGSNTLPPSGTAIAAHYALGMYRIRFSRVWSHVPALVHALLGSSRKANPSSKLMWTLVVDALSRSHGVGSGVDGVCPGESRDSSWDSYAIDGIGHDADYDPVEEHSDRHSRMAAVPYADREPSDAEESPNLGSCVAEAWLACTAKASAETDLGHLASQLLRALSAPGTALLRFAVKDSASLMPLWRRLAQTHLRTVAVDVSDAEDDPSGSDEVTTMSSKGGGVSHAAAPPKRLLSDWLRFFAAVESPRSLASAEALYSDCCGLLGHSLPSVQILALDCLSRWAEPPIVKYRKQLIGLIEGKTFRETLTLFSVDSQSSTLTKDERALLLPLLSRILFSRLTRRTGRGSSKNGMASMRATVFAFFGGFEPGELKPLLDLMLAPIRTTVAVRSSLASQAGTRMKSRDDVGVAKEGHIPTAIGEEGSRAAAALCQVEGSTLLGVLRSLHEATSQLGVSLMPYLEQLLNTTNLLLRYAANRIAASDPEEEALLPRAVQIDHESLMGDWPSSALPAHVARDLRGWAVKLMCKFACLSPRGLAATAEHSRLLRAALPITFQCLTPVLRRLHTHYTQSPSGILSLLLLLTQDRRTLPFLNLSPEPPIQCAFKCISATAVAPAVIDVVLGIAEALLAHVDHAKSAAKRASAAADFVASIQISAEANYVGDWGSLSKDLESKGWDPQEASVVAAQTAVESARAAEAAQIAQGFIEAEVSLLLSQLHARLVSKFGEGVDPTKALAAAGSADQATRELRILSALIGYVSSSEQADHLVQLFLPYLRLKSSSRAEKLKAGVLDLLAGLLPRLQAPEGHAKFLGLQFGNLRSRESRAALCRVWSSLAEVLDGRAAVAAAWGTVDCSTASSGNAVESMHGLVPRGGLRQVATALTELNAYSTSNIDDLDYDRRINAYNQVPALLTGISRESLGVSPDSRGSPVVQPEFPLFPPELGPAATIPLLSQCVHDLELDDIALRHSASHTLAIIIRHAVLHATPQRNRQGREECAAEGAREGDRKRDGGGKCMDVAHALSAPNVKQRKREAKRNASATGRSTNTLSGSDLTDDSPTLRSQNEHASEWRSLLVDVLMPALRRGLRLPPERELVRAEMIRLLSVTLLADPTLEPQLARLLSPKDPEADFFANIVHIQLPRRQRALARLRQKIEQGFFSAGTLSNYLLPLLSHIALKNTAKEIDVAEEAVMTLRALATQLPWRPYHELLQTLIRKLKREPNLEKRLVRAMVATIEGFHFDLSVADDEMSVCVPGKAQAAARNDVTSAISTVSDTAAKADVMDTEGAAEEAMADEAEEDVGAEGEVLLGAEDAAAAAAADTDAAAAAAAESDERAARARATAILGTVRNRLLPPLYAHMRDPKTEGARVAVAVAVLKLLKLMPPRVLEMQLKPFLMRLVSTLSSRDKAVRAKGREALGLVTIELGAGHFRAVLHELETSLKRGYQLQVLGYTIHYLLAKLVPTLPAGGLDGCAPLLVRLLLADVFGEAAEKKEVDAIANSMAEARSTMSYSSFELLSSNISFVPTINELVPPIHRAAADAGGQHSLKVANKARELFRRCAQGLATNPTIALQPLCVYSSGLLTSHLPPKPEGAGPQLGQDSFPAPVPAAKRQRHAAPVDSVLRPAVEEGVTSGGGSGPLSQELLAFALTLLLGALRRARIDARNAAVMALLEPFPPLLQRAMRCDDDAVVSLALRSLGAMLHLPISSLPAHATILLDRTMNLLKRCANFKPISDLAAVCVKVVTALIRNPPRQKPNGTSRLQSATDDPSANDDPTVEADDDNEVLEMADSTEIVVQPNLGGGGARLNEAQLRWLLGFVTVHLDDIGIQSSLFGLLRAILSRKFVVAELYDMMLTIGDLVLQADSEGTRSACSTLFLVFLLNYPLGPKRLQQQLDFLTLNLSYEVAQGRVSLLALVRQIAAKLPLPLLFEQLDRLLLPLVTRLVNETERQCVASVNAAVETLLARTCGLAGGPQASGARERVLTLLRAWFGDARRKPALGRAAARLAGLLVDAIDENIIATLAPTLLPLLVGACVAEVDCADDVGTEKTKKSKEGASEGPDGSSAITGDESDLAVDLTVSALRWQTAYFALKAFGRLCAKQRHLILTAPCAPLWKYARPLLLHEHAWVRLAMSRAIGALLAEVSPEQLARYASETPKVQESGRNSRTSKGVHGAAFAGAMAAAAVDEAAVAILGSPGMLLRIADASVAQLRSPLLSEPAAAQTLRNLLWIALALVAHPVLAPLAMADELRARRGLAGDRVSGDDGVEEDGVEDGDESGGEREAEAVNGGEVDAQLWPLVALSSRLAPLTRRPGPVRGGAAVRWFGALASQLSRTQLDTLLESILPPIMRSAEDSSGKVDPLVKSQAAEVLTLIQRAASPPTFVRVYQRVHDSQKAARVERKRRAAVAAVADPEAAARHRISRNLGKKAAKARKLEKLKRNRDGGGSLGLGTGKKRRQVEARR